MAAREVEPVVVLGLGRFGQSVALALTREGCEVLAVDRDPDLVREVEQAGDHGRAGRRHEP